MPDYKVIVSQHPDLEAGPNDLIYSVYDEQNQELHGVYHSGDAAWERVRELQMANPSFIITEQQCQERLASPKNLANKMKAIRDANKERETFPDKISGTHAGHEES